MNKTVFLLSLICVASSQAVIIDPTAVRTRNAQNIQLSYNQGAFSIHDGERTICVPSYDTASIFRGRSEQDIQRFAQIGKFLVKRYDSGEYAVDAQGGLNGGGPVLGAIVYWTVKVSAYGAIAVVSAVDPLLIPEVPLLVPFVEGAAAAAGAAAGVAPTP